MKTVEVVYTYSPFGGSSKLEHHYEIVAEPVDFETGEAHVELGGRLIAMKDNAVYQLFDNQFGPTFAGLWTGCTFHLVVKER